MLDEFYKILSVFFFFVFTDTADHTEFFQSRRDLTRAKFLKKSANGTYEQVDKSLQMSVTALPMHVRKMHSEMATLAKDAIEEFPVEERNFTGITMGIDDKDYAEILKELENCRKRILSIATAKKGGNRVYRLNLQMFPLTDKVERTEAK